MAEPNAEQLAEWEEWLAGRPPAVAEVAREKPPWRLYRLTTTGQRGPITSYGETEDGRCLVTMEFGPPLNVSPVTLGVFDIDPETVEETDDWRPWYEVE